MSSLLSKRCPNRDWDVPDERGPSRRHHPDPFERPTARPNRRLLGRDHQETHSDRVPVLRVRRIGPSSVCSVRAAAERNESSCRIVHCGTSRKNSLTDGQSQETAIARLQDRRVSDGSALR